MKKKKIIITIITTIIMTAIMVTTKIAVFGTKKDYIADYMPSPGMIHIDERGKTKNVNIRTDDASVFPFVAHKESLLRIFWFVIADLAFISLYSWILFKLKIYTTKKDLYYSAIVFAVPLVICYLLIYTQLGYTV